MPIYEYACSECGKVTDVFQKLNDPPPEACEHCGAKNTLSRVVSRTSFVLKGGGWYSDLYSSKKDTTKSEAASETKSSAAPAESKPSSSTSSSASGTAASSTSSTAKDGSKG